MRGFPPIQIFLLVLAFIVLAVPLGHLTGNAQEKSAPQVVAKEKQSMKALLRLRFAHKPSTFSLKIADKELIAAIDPPPIEIDTVLASLEEGVDAFLSATWPDGTPDTALTLEIEPDGLEARSETRWSSAGSIDEVITFIWE